ncbi:vacuolar protein sorting-associated protein 55 homolog isoform X2 [Phoenix dactylifera]|nr:vacuolar protein sorting-associated protein 55 homolog isoform X2 [Phoenix dactylifera]
MNASLAFLLHAFVLLLEFYHTLRGLSRSMLACLHTGQLALLAILVSSGIVLQVLACALYNNWWPMLTVIMYVILPMPLMFFMGSKSTSLMSSDGDGWANFTKFLTGASVVGSIAIPSILKHAGIIGWGALAMELSSFLVFAVATLWMLQMSNEDGYSML